MLEEDNRIDVVRGLLLEYVQSPALRHIRDTNALSRLARDIVRGLDRGASLWSKWEGQRELLLKSAVPCWIPVEDLHTALNRLPGPTLTLTDVFSRMSAMEEEASCALPNEDLRDGCLTIYDEEQRQGTEMIAIISRLRAHVEQEEQRLQRERENTWREARVRERADREQRLRSGADCGWTQPSGTGSWFCRKNGRTYQLVPSRDKRCELRRVDPDLSRVTSPILGIYQGRADATKAIQQLAYRSEPLSWRGSS